VIFVTVGTSQPFDRLIRAVDMWAKLKDRTNILAQIGRSHYVPQRIKAVQFLSPSEFRRCAQVSQFIVAHAGVGSIITALQAGKPLIVMPRSARLREHVNEHQIATAKCLAQRFGITVAEDEVELAEKLDKAERLRDLDPLRLEASSELISTIRTFITG
jgi:exopolysaccharide biosynthesis glucuronosyltransferase PssE